MNLDLKGKKAIVCGSTQGLGFASAVELALLGAEVTLVARDEKKLKEAVKKLDITFGQKHTYIVADFHYPEVVEKSITNYMVNNSTVNILVNNTGGPKGGNAVDAAPEDFLQAFNSHLICNHILMKAVLPSMKASGYGRIINIISTSVKEPIPGLGVSNTIRAAVASWSKTLAGELGKFGITVNNVLPGYTRTARYDSIVKNKVAATEKNEKEIEADFIAAIPMQKIGTPEEFGAAVAFLCSPAASYITGINLPVDGGRLACL
ncbi:SDR family oxidoreductase [Ginsengibacter hankyongi]|uniref:SDR family oxidoreductase n=1 Tax=Ginsengibacter hankyongi TaxID=2607284 RepID=A0A5J5IAN1_9BACT|nr:SDR family oxidoreductase [Ginsengibacter hankyongi]KAA9034503.1 SDR family oxidoreductase [Ginsengibacter hankyongi]